ncbi:hypothetical protein GcM1_161007, partial [Golovinomyces cichoracearum]
VESSTREDLFAIAYLTSNASLSLLKTPEWKKFSKSANFKPPDHRKPTDVFLPPIYYMIKSQVQAVADASDSLQIVSDGPSNVSKVRVENFSFMTGGISSYCKSIGLGAVIISAQNTVHYFIETAKEVTKKQPHLWTSFSSGPCSTQRSF